MNDSNISVCIRILSNFPIIYKTGNLSPYQIMLGSDYSTLFSSITTEDIAQYLIKNPRLIDEWSLYSEDIRHSPAWGFGQGKDGNGM